MQEFAYSSRDFSDFSGLVNYIRACSRNLFREVAAQEGRRWPVEGPTQFKKGSDCKQHHGPGSCRSNMNVKATSNEKQNHCPWQLTLRRLQFAPCPSDEPLRVPAQKNKNL